MGFLLLSPQLPAATGSGIHISQPRIFQPWWRGEAIKTSPGFFKSVSFFPPFFFFFFFFSVNSIHFGKGSKNTIVARRRDTEGEGESIDLHAHIVMDKTDSLLFAGFLKKTKQETDFGIQGCAPEMYQLDRTRSPLLARLSLCLLKCGVSRRQHRLHRAGLQAEPFDCGQQGVREN